MQIGRTLGEFYDEADRTGAAILALVRDGKRRYGAAREAEIAAGDILLVEAEAEALDELRASLKLDFAEHRRKSYLEAEKAGLVLVEVAVPATARIRGKTAEAVDLVWRHRTLLMGISRRGQRISGPLRKAVVRSGDLLLLLAPAETAEDVVDWLGCLPLAERGLAVTKHELAGAATAIFAAAVQAASLGRIDLPVALGGVAVGYVANRVLPLSDLYDHIEWPVIVLLGSMIPLGAALEGREAPGSSQGRSSASRPGRRPGGRSSS